VLSAPVRVYKTGFDLARIRVLPRGQHLLVMDRVSGKWITLAREHAPFLKLLGASQAACLAPEVRQRVEQMGRLLLDNRIGVSGTERRFDTLNTVIIKLTNACNLACAYCYDYERMEDSRRLEAQTALRAIAQALDLCERHLCVILHGGEPMLLWNLIEELVQEGESMARARGKDIRFSGQSNMTRLNQRIVDFSLEHDIAWGISLDGPPETHDRFRVRHDGQGSYTMFQASLEKYPAFVRRCGVMSTITQTNQDKLLEAARFFRDLGMASWDWSLFQPIGRGRDDMHRFEIDSEVVCGAWDELFHAVEAGEFAGFGVMPVKKYLDNFLGGPGHNMCMRPECGAARDLLSISADGTIEACDCIDPTGPLSNLGHMDEGGLAEARESPTAQSIRSRNVQQEACGDCIWYGVCGGTCLAHSPALHRVWADACTISQLAFDRISNSLLAGDALLDYAHSL
jgi:uncharacterized protein